MSSAMSDIRYVTTIEDIDWPTLRDDLVADDFHNGRTVDELRRSFLNSGATAFAKLDGRTIGKARALTDGVCNAYVVDVWTHSAHRRQGIATRLMRELESQLEGQHVCLFTDDALQFYERIGYVHRGPALERVIGRWLKRFDPPPVGED
jgi:predicted GNAT family acetyltransferase